MTIKDLISAMFQLGIDRYEEKNDKVELSYGCISVGTEYSLQMTIDDLMHIRVGTYLMAFSHLLQVLARHLLLLLYRVRVSP